MKTKDNYKIIRKLKLLEAFSLIFNTILSIINFGWLLVNTANNGISFRAILIFMVIGTVINEANNIVALFVAEKIKKLRAVRELFDKFQDAVEAVVEAYKKEHPEATKEHTIEHFSSLVEFFVSSKLEKEDKNNG